MCNKERDQRADSFLLNRSSYCYISSHVKLISSIVCEARILETADFCTCEASQERKTHLVWLHVIFLLVWPDFLKSGVYFQLPDIVRSLIFPGFYKTLSPEMHRQLLLLQGPANENSNSTLIYCKNSVIKSLICDISWIKVIWANVNACFLRTKTNWPVLICAFPWFTSFEQPQKRASLAGCLQAVCGLKPWPCSAPKPELEPAVRPTTSPCCV